MLVSKDFALLSGRLLGAPDMALLTDDTSSRHTTLMLGFKVSCTASVDPDSPVGSF